MDDEAVQRIAYAHPSRLGIVDDRSTDARVAVFVKIQVDDPCAGLDDGYFGVVAHEVDEFFASARDAHVNVAHGVEHLRCRLVCGGQQFSHGGVDAVVAEYVVNESYGCAVGAVGVFAAFQYTGGAAFQTEREDVKGDVGPCLIDDAYDTKGHTHSFQFKSVLQYSVLEYPS